MAKLLLSIKPEYVEKILSGEKKYEYRKRLSREPVNTIIIYSSYPVQKVVGEVNVLGTLTMEPTPLWEETKREAGITREKFRLYFKGCSKACAYKLGRVTLFNPEKTLKDFGLRHAPQSFVYIHDE